MNSGKSEQSICCLCGKRIEPNPVAPEEAFSKDHVPPKQFYPKELRESRNLNLWSVPTHKRCNESYREDEEYFYHAMYFAVGNEQMGRVIYRDFRRRVRHPQTPAMIRKVLNTSASTTESGIILPPRIVRVSVDKHRTQRVAIKVAQGLFHLECQGFLPGANCRDIRLCIGEDEVPEFYQLSWQGAETQAVCADVFAYRHLYCEGLHIWSMLFWQSFMICAAFDEPSTSTASHDEADSNPRMVN